jgi:hypothetical protein
VPQVEDHWSRVPLCSMPVIQYIGMTVSEEDTAFISYPEDGSNVSDRNVGNHTCKVTQCLLLYETITLAMEPRINTCHIPRGNHTNCEDNRLTIFKK